VSKIKNSRLDQYGAESFKQQQFGTAGVLGVKKLKIMLYLIWALGWSWSQSVDNSTQVISHKPAVGCHYFLPGPHN